MKLVFDNIIFDIQKSGGISVVWYELLKRSQKSTACECLYLDTPTADNHFRKMLTLDEAAILQDNKPTWLTRSLPVRLRLKEPFIFHSSYYRYCTNPLTINVSTVHDFTKEICENSLRNKLHTLQKFRALRHSDYIVCISENTKRDLMRFLPDIQEDRVRIIYNGVSDDYSVLAAQPPLSLPYPPHTYVLFVGNRAPYKNFSLVAQALAHSTLHLVIVGPNLTPKETDELSRYIPENRYKSLGFVPNKELNVLYNHAACLAYPSSYEGFGIPVIEAQKAGCPVIAYNATSIPEVLGKSPLLMESATTEALVGKLRLLSDQGLMESVRQEGLKNAQRFSWDLMAKGYQKLYTEIADKRK